MCPLNISYSLTILEYNLKLEQEVIFMNTQAPSQSEFEVLKTVWGFGPSTSTTLSSALAQSKKWEKNTVKTLLSRLVSKGLLTTEKIGREYIYSPTLSESELYKIQTNIFIETFCTTRRAEIIEHLILSQNITESQKLSLISTLNTKETVDEVTCTCASAHHSSCQCESEQCGCKQ